VCRAKANGANAQQEREQNAKSASERDAFERFLLSPSEELSIEGFLSASADGRFAVFMQHGALILWDSATASSLDLSALGADARLSAESGAAVRTVDFDARSEHLLYVRRRDERTRVVIRDLRDESEQELDPGPGEVWRARFDPGGVYAVLQVITADTNRNRKLDFPAPLLAAPRACGEERAHFHTWEGRGDRPETVLLPLDGAPLVREPDLLMPVRDALLLRDEDGVLSLSRGEKKRVLEPATCKGRVVHADAERELFIVGCAQKKKTGRVSLELVTRDGRKPLNLELSSVELDREMSDSPRLVALYPGSDTVLFDADKRDVLTLQPEDSVIAIRGARALVRRNKSLFLYDAETRRETPLPGELAQFPELLVALPFVFVSPLVVNLDSGQVAGVSKARPLALTTTGQLLLAETPADGNIWPRAPLRWVTPPPFVPAAPTSTPMPTPMP
jgi:hypothetical protein